jgi:hypothetical protein
MLAIVIMGMVYLVHQHMLLRTDVSDMERYIVETYSAVVAPRKTPVGGVSRGVAAAPPDDDDYFGALPAPSGPSRRPQMSMAPPQQQQPSRAQHAAPPPRRAQPMGPREDTADDVMDEISSRVVSTRR